ncbi:restriction endonuclease subunit S [Streptosporangium sp. NPDC048047]|uniref:restriction endonuclease subunit S n=1 Tax=Streptosporangium sp. NPDC048047 TaxID=3155748 RepID=UPI00343D54F7
MSGADLAPWLAQSKWPTVPIRYVAKLGTGHTPSRQHSEYWEDCTIPWITLADVWQLRDGTRDTVVETKEKISRLGLANSAAVLHPAGTVILSRTASVGFSAIMGQDMATSQDFATWTCGPKIEPRYLLHALRAMAPDLRRVAAGSTHKTIYMPDIEQLRLPLPPTDEQRRIVQYLDAKIAYLHSLKELRERQVNLISERRSAFIRSLVAGESSSATRRKTGSPWVPSVPIHWGVLPLKRRWSIVDCKHRTPDYVDHGYPVVSPGDVTVGRLDLSRAHRFVDGDDFRDLADGPRRPRRGDIIYSRNASVGIASYVDTDEPFTMGQDVCRITSKSESQLYLYYVLNFMAQSQLEALQIGSIFARVNIGALLDLLVPCPPRQEQEEIARRIDVEFGRYERTMKVLKNQILLISERQQALIVAAVTGQIDMATT